MVNKISIEICSQEPCDFSHRRFSCFSRGRYDNFACPIGFRSVNGICYSYPRDEFCFSRLLYLASVFGNELIYDDFLTLYTMTTDTVSIDVLRYFFKKAKAFGDFAGLYYNTFVMYHYLMISEEHYQRVFCDRIFRTKIGKLMKLYAVYSLLILNKSIREVSCENISVNPFQIEKKANALGLFRHVCWVPYSTAYDKVSMLPSFSDVVKKVSYI